MRKSGFRLIRKTLRRMHRKKGVYDLIIPPDIQKDSIVRFVIQGKGEFNEDDGSFRGVGDYDSESKSYKIRLHIHGKNYLSGREFAEIHLSKNIGSDTAPTLNDTLYAFTPNKDVGGVPIIDKSIIRFKEKTAYTLAFTVSYASASKPRDLKLTFVYTDGTTYTPTKDNYNSTFTECVSTDPEKTLDRICSYKGDGQLTAYTLANFGIYEGVYETHAEAHEAYVGERLEISLDAPLYAIESAADELDLLSGNVTRKIRTERIDGTAEIKNTDMDGIFSIALKNKARCNSTVISHYGILVDGTDVGIKGSEDGSAILFKTPSRIKSIEDLSEYLSANPFDIAYISAEPTVIASGIKLPDTYGKTILNILTEFKPKKCFIEYY